MSYSTFLILSSQFEINEGQDNLKKKAIKEYQKALTLPRKKKKQAKKSALLLYSIASYDLFS